MSLSATLRHLADAYDALQKAYDATEDGFTSDYIETAQKNVRQAVSQAASVEEHSKS
jgi:Mg2+ and Co2+ transporter CorA